MYGDAVVKQCWEVVVRVRNKQSFVGMTFVPAATAQLPINAQGDFFGMRGNCCLVCDYSVLPLKADTCKAKLIYR